MMHSNQKNKVYIGDLNKAELLIELYNNAPVQGFGRSCDRSNLSIEDARELIDNQKGDFDYLNGRVLKVNLSEDYLDTWLYNRDNCPGRAEKIVEELRKKQISSQVTTPQVESYSEERGK